MTTIAGCDCAALGVRVVSVVSRAWLGECVAEV
jgi:hypothetical protein